jgi:M6 family metalloprotease-like protein
MTHKHFVITSILVFTLSLFIQKDVIAVSAYPFPIEYKQPDGTVVTITMKGDENVRWAETQDGYSLLRNSKGGWEYGIIDKSGDMVCSGVLAKQIDQRTLNDMSILQKTRKKLTFSKSQVGILKQVAQMKSAQITNAFPTTDTIKLLMILIEFDDLEFTKSQTDFENLMNQHNFNGTGSFKDFYTENSYQQLTIETTVAGIYTAVNEMAYYGTNEPSDDYRVKELITEAVNQADEDVNFADFDNDGDGKVDGVYVIYAGYGEEAGGGSTPDAIWAHASSISTLTLDGVKVSKYACSCELRGNSGTEITGIGVICHEFGHSLGSKDYYDTNYGTDGQYPGTDAWDVMAGGNWNNHGDTPAHHNPYTKSNVYHWATPTLISNAQTVNLRDAKNYPDIVQINTKKPNEYFLCENRQWTGFNYWLPGHGMIIYHVDGDYIASHTFGNTINCGAHQGMYVVSAASTTGTGVMLDGDINTEDCPWPGTGEITTFDDETTPNLKSWDGDKTETPLTNISETSGIISFDIEFKSLGDFTATPVSTSQIELSWTNNTNSDPVMIAVNSTSTFGTPVDATTYSAGNTISGGGTVIFNSTETSFNHTSLSPNTVYYYKAWSVLTDNVYTSGIVANAKTLCGPSTLPFTETFDEETIPDCWSQVDHQGNGQIWKFGITGSFGDGAPNLTGGNYAYLNSDAYGDGNSQNAELITPTLDMSGFSDVNIQFNHFHQYWADTYATATLLYSIDDGSSWSELHRWTSTTVNPAAFNQDVPALDGQSLVKIKWNYSATYGGGWAIDDISITGTPDVPPTIEIANVTIGSGEGTCYDATDTITVAGNSTTVDFLTGSLVDLIAGKSIFFLPGFHSHQGSTMNASITTEALFCDARPLRSQVSQNNEKSTSVPEYLNAKQVVDKKEKMVKVYPNPNKGRFTLELINFEGSSEISIINTFGTVVYKNNISNSAFSEFELTNLHKGLYFINVRNGNYIKTNKIIVQ